MIHRCIPELNRRSFTDKDLEGLARQSGISLIADRHVEYGYAYRDGRHKIILYNPDMPPLRRRHVMGHELAHILLGHGGVINAYDGFFREDLELEAMRVASHLIYPLSDSYKSFINCWLIDAEPIYEFVRNCDITDNEAVDFALREQEHIEKTYRMLSQSCPFGRLCLQGKVCPFIKDVFFK